jgi:hypothetical protein
MWIALHMCVIVSQDMEEEFMLRMVDSLDDETVVSREVEEGSRFTGRTQFGEDVFCCE